MQHSLKLRLHVPETRRLLALTVVLGGCVGPTETHATWLEHVGYRWDVSNHRLSYLHLDIEEDLANVAVIGGTSTTGIAPPLADGCELATCVEFPLEDTADVSLGWGRAVSTSAVFAHGSVEWLVDAEGGATELTVSLPRAVEGDVAAVLRGFVIDTDHPLAGGITSCYVPANGWHLRELGISLGDPVLSADGLEVVVPIDGTFVAGVSGEDGRACTDAVVGDAVVMMRADVQVVAGATGVSDVAVTHGEVYALEDEAGDPVEQPDPDLAARSVAFDVAATLSGWRDWHFAFDDDLGSGKGAYVRSLSLGLSAEDGWASGHATNIAPAVFHLDGFAYTFSGTVVGIEAEAEVTRSAWQGDLPAQVDEAYEPVIHEVTLP